MAAVTVTYAILSIMSSLSKQMVDVQMEGILYKKNSMCGAHS